jgi:hypothetical protein
MVYEIVHIETWILGENPVVWAYRKTDNLEAHLGIMNSLRADISGLYDPNERRFIHRLKSNSKRAESAAYFKIISKYYSDLKSGKNVKRGVLFLGSIK